MNDELPADAITVTSWSEPPWDAVERGEVDGAVRGEFRYARFPIGVPGEPDHRALILAQHPPNSVIPAHYHETDVLEVVVQGSVKHEGVWYGPGFTWFIRARTMKPEQQIGPEGYLKVILHCDESKGVPSDRADAGAVLERLAASAPAAERSSEEAAGE